jgi:putative endonuclease
MQDEKARKPSPDVGPDDRTGTDEPASVAATTTLLGRAGESLALRHLERAGLTLVVRNYRCRAGEIDLVLRDPEGPVLVLVEVRSRSRRDYGGAAASIGAAKRRRFSLAARHLLLTHRELRRLRVRFDVVAIDPSRDGGEPVVTWLRGAFGLS